MREICECSCWPVEVVVEPHAGGEREEFGGDAGAQAVEGSGAVAFEPEAVFERPEDRLDALSDRGEVWSVSGFVLAWGLRISAPCRSATSAASSRPT